MVCKFLQAFAQNGFCRLSASSERLIKLANLYTSLCYNLWFLVSVVNVKGYACRYAMASDVCLHVALLIFAFCPPLTFSDSIDVSVE